MKTVRVFTKNEPCNKVDIWNCFRAEAGNKFVSVPIVEARDAIGISVPSHLVRAGRAEMIKGGDSIRLTSEGKTWLRAGTVRYVRNQVKGGNTDIVESVYNPPSGLLLDVA